MRKLFNADVIKGIEHCPKFPTEIKLLLLLVGFKCLGDFLSR